MRILGIDSKINGTKEKINNSEKVRLYSLGSLLLSTAGFVALGCFLSPFWLLGTIFTIPTATFAYISTTSSIKRYKNKLNELIEQKELNDSINEKVKSFDYQKDIKISSKTKKSIISNKIENTETKDNDLKL